MIAVALASIIDRSGVDSIRVGAVTLVAVTVVAIALFVVALGAILVAEVALEIGANGLARVTSQRLYDHMWLLEVSGLHRGAAIIALCHPTN